MPLHVTKNEMPNNWNARFNAMYARHEYQHAAVSNASTSTNLPTSLISLPVQMPTKAGIESEITGLKGHVNTIYGILRGGGLLAS